MRAFTAYLPHIRRGTVLGLSLACMSGAHAFGIDVDNPDVKIRWDNTLRYNLGVRTEKQNAAIMNTPPYDNSDAKFGRGDLVANRLDLLSEFDVVYKGDHGFRISGAGWYDQAYHDQSIKGTPGAYPNDRYNSSAKRFTRGPSGELLDAFVFTKFEAGEVPVSLKLGRHNVYWGESMFSLTNSIAYSQGSLDSIKGTASPGTQAKELFLPLNQFSVSAQVTQDLSVGAQYLLEWDPWRLPYGGSYFGTANFFNLEGGTFLAPGFPFNGAQNRPKNVGDFGLMARWTPAWMDGTAGVYYRQFDEKLPWLGVNADGGHLAYARDTKLLGLSFATTVAGVSVGSELSYRKGTALNSANVVSEGARGDTWHALVNAVQYFGSSPLWDSAPLMAELNYTYLDKVTQNSALFAMRGSAACPGGVKDGCMTRDAWALNLSLEPVWYQVFPGVDLKLPLNFGIGLKGNAPNLGGSREGNGSWSVGVSAEVRNQYFVTLRYADYLHKMGTTNGAVSSENAGGSLYRDRGWVSLTLKTSF